MSEEKTGTGGGATVFDFSKWARAPVPDERGPGGGGPGGGDPGGPGAPGGADEGRPIWASDDALAAALVERLAGDWRYVADAGFWRRWTGRRWEEDSCDLVHDLARGICREIAAQCSSMQLARAVASSRAINAAVTIAARDPAIAMLADGFDADPMLLNTLDGIVDLTTGVLGPHRRAAHLSMMAAAGPYGECPRFARFLDEFTAGDRDYQLYLLRLGGYCLSGSMREHVLVFLWGEHGGEGKGVLVRTLCHVLGDYAGVAMPGMFMVTQGERHPTEIAALVGKRLVVATETQQGQEWDEAKLKSISGGDPQTARVTRGDPFTFKPQCKLVMSGNHKPRMRSADGGMRRRLQLCPCVHVPEKPDPELEDALRREAGGILKLLIAGAIDWQAKGGLHPPAVVAQATDLYFEEQNPVARWFAERCEVVPIDPKAPVIELRVLYNDYKRWMVEVGERAASLLRFSERFRKLPGVRLGRQHGGPRGWQGVRLLPLDVAEEEFGFGRR
ncbi:MAG TPA: phage/plasmid primase, P4 family [Stellaceae bacterium]|jgi:putative DNA primase/helicase